MENNTNTLLSTSTIRSVEAKVFEFYQYFQKNDNRKARRLAFYENKEPSLLSRSEYDKLLEIHQKLHGENREDKIIAASEFAARCRHFTIEEFDWRFVIAVSFYDLNLIEALAPDVKEYLDHHNTERFGFCLMKDGNTPLKEELTPLYTDDIDTYNEVVRFTREMLEFN